jgi:hypothetical protein
VHSINKRLSQASFATFLALTLSASAIAAPLVVRSAGPSAKAYPAGKALADNAKITLKAGDTIVLLDGKGTRTLSGPGTFSATATQVAAASTSSTMAALVSGGGERRARIGAVRSVSGTDKSGKNPSVWYVDLSRSSNMCVVDAANVTVWRQNADAAADVTVTRVADGATGSLKFSAGQSNIAWPKTVAVADGSQYKLSWDGAKAPTAVKFIVVKPETQDIQGMTQSLIKAGCQAQVNQVIEATASADKPAPEKPAPKG